MVNSNGDDFTFVDAIYKDPDSATQFTGYNTVTSTTTDVDPGLPGSFAKPDFASHKECGSCPRNFECMTGTVPSILLDVEKDSKTEKEKYFLPCVDNGQRLVIDGSFSWAGTTSGFTTVTLPQTPSDGSAVTITGINSGDLITTDTITITATDSSVEHAGLTLAPYETATFVSTKDGWEIVA